MWTVSTCEVSHCLKCLIVWSVSLFDVSCFLRWCPWGGCGWVLLSPTHYHTGADGSPLLLSAAITGQPHLHNTESASERNHFNSGEWEGGSINKSTVHTYCTCFYMQVQFSTCTCMCMYRTLKYRVQCSVYISSTVFLYIHINTCTFVSCSGNQQSSWKTFSKSHRNQRLVAHTTQVLYTVCL